VKKLGGWARDWCIQSGMTQPPLFPDSGIQSSSSSAEEKPSREPRLVHAQRHQVELVPRALDEALPPEHRARAIWEVVEKLDLSKFYERIGAREGKAGRPATDPKIFVALWLYATSEGVGSARQLARLCESQDAYRWLCGGVSVNHHTLGDFRVGHQEALDSLMTQVLAVMMQQGLVELERVAQDGTKVRASAGAASFRRQESLEKCLEEARAQVEHAKQQKDGTDLELNARQKAAQERAARERKEKVEAALAQLPDVQETKKRNGAKKEEARVSTTDSEARVMKMPDGGFCPASITFSPRRQLFLPIRLNC